MKTYPANLRHKDPAIINLKALGEANAIIQASLLKYRSSLQRLAFIEAILECPFQIFQLLLQNLRRALLQKAVLFGSLPHSEPESHFIVPEDRLTLLQAIQIHSQTLIPKKTGRTTISN